MKRNSKHRCFTPSTAALGLTLLLSAATAASHGCKRSSKKGSSELPGAPAFTAELRAEFASARKQLGPDYVPRTKHLSSKGDALFTNRLIKSSSPYLLQHAHNPVNWHPWGDEAFEEAERRGVPVLISIGYSTCHWCHVMEEESFEDIEIATALNKNYVAIKVDREERPDIDSIYQAANRAMKRKGGWPLNVWLTPKRKPFFGGTYFPPRKGVRGARVGFIDILGRAKEEFDTNRTELEKSAEMIAARVAAISAPAASSGGEPPGLEVIEPAVTALLSRLDRVDGGQLPSKTNRSKFPSTFPNRLLLRYASRAIDSQRSLEAREAVRLTLAKMAGGGIYDQVGGGFHRYSVDPRWLVPHFEKMLYDNARLIVTYLEGFQALNEPAFAGIATDIAAYLVKEMRSPEGGFYSATDADSLSPEGHREEGAFFVWTAKELAEVLPAADAQLVDAIWGATEGGNFEGNNILNFTSSDDFFAREPATDKGSELRRIRDQLYEARKAKAPPLRDDKILAAWNGLVLSALARAAAVLPADFQPRALAHGSGLDFTKLATETARFILDKLIVDGRLRRAYKGGRAYGIAFAEDYAFVIAGLIELFEATGEPRWLTEALALQKTLDRHYRSKSGGYFATAADGEVLITREVPKRDGAVPSANSVAALNLLRFYELTSEPSHLAAADELLAAFGSQLRGSPLSLTEMLIAVDFRAGVTKEIVIASAGSAEGPDDGGLLDVLRASYAPRTVIVRKGPTAPAALADAVPLSSGKTALGGKPTVYVCEQSRCELPTSDPVVFAKQLSVSGHRGSSADGTGAKPTKPLEKPQTFEKQRKVPGPTKDGQK